MPALRPLGLYVHVPYCRSLCPYCDFFSLARAPDPGFVDALLAELDARRGEILTPRPATTLYLGGGTPSLLDASQVARLIDGVRERVGLAADAEVTLEANPGDLDAARVGGWRTAGVNRLSLGVQSLDDRGLRVLGRRHGAATARAAIAHARRAGFDNLGLDLILAIPGQDLAASAADVDALVAQGAEHVSAYLLSIEADTPLAAAVARGEVPPVDEDLAADMLEQACARLAAAGYHRYEISNHARPGRAARHNRLYWSGDEVLGLGPGAHSYLRREHGGWRHSSPDDIEAWLRCWRDGEPAAPDPGTCVDERLRGPDHVRERIYLGLRDLERGIDLAALLDEAGLVAWPALHRELASLAGDGLLQAHGSVWCLTPRGAALADAVARRVLAVDARGSALRAK